jgi:cell fate (sporulation/competence/biofilm development) regulator YlbF (YheA/YmcA/DUF963 family)
MFRTLTPTLAIIASLIIFFLFVQPQYAALSSTRVEIESYEKAQSDYENFIRKIEGFETVRDRVSVIERDRLDALIPREIDSTQLLVDLEALAENNFLLFGNIEVSETARALDEEAESDTRESGRVSAPPEHVDISFEVIGTYDQFKEFLLDLEQSLTLYEITRIALSAPPESSFMQYSVSVRSYALPALIQ